MSNIAYFGEPVYSYSLKQGIRDGFLASCNVVEVRIDRDVEEYRPERCLVVLSQRRDYWLLKTAYCTEKPKRTMQLRRERDNYRQAGQPAGDGTQNS